MAGPFLKAKMVDNSLLNIPHYVVAKDPEELKLKMLALQVRLKSKLTFFDIQPYKKGFIAWYEFKIDPRAAQSGK